MSTVLYIPTMTLLKAAALFFLASGALALPVPNLEARQSIDTSNHCGQWDVVSAGPYALLTDLWGASGATSGSQCSNLVSLSGNTISWKTTWDWVGGNGVKSFSNIQLNQGINKQLKSINSMPVSILCNRWKWSHTDRCPRRPHKQTTWKWSQSTSGKIVADVAYDLFTSNTAGGSNVNEIMIWLANFNAGPISAVYNSDGTPQPAASNVDIAGHTWNLYSGSNGANNVFSFLPTSGTITSFSGDIMQFLNVSLQTFFQVDDILDAVIFGY